MSVSWQQDPNDDPIAPSRGVVIGSFLGLCAWSLIAGVVLFFFLNGWSF